MFKREEGFTLIELAIVLIIIGLILGMVFKSRQLIDSAKVKSLAAQYNKIIAAVNTFYDRYGFYPGDGCPTGTPASPADCTGTKDGIIQNNQERDAFWHLLINVTHILSEADRRSVFGQNWNIWYNNFGDRSGDWLDLPGTNQMDIRFLCALDRMIDDGNSTTGDIRSSGTYGPSDDCWELTGQVDGWLYVLP